jgi:solute carrier family 25 carnitine/acylcarnitine transporter 20/29
MSATVMKTGEKPAASAAVDPADRAPKHYRGFVAGVFSGVAKLSGMPCVQRRHPRVKY